MPMISCLPCVLLFPSAHCLSFQASFHQPIILVISIKVFHILHSVQMFIGPSQVLSYYHFTYFISFLPRTVQTPSTRDMLSVALHFYYRPLNLRYIFSDSSSMSNQIQCLVRIHLPILLDILNS